MTIKGVVGKIVWAYYNAAAINGYAVSCKDKKWFLRGTVVPGLVNAYNMAQRPLFFVAPHDKGEWRWPLERFEIHEGVLRAHLGKPEKTRANDQQVRTTRDMHAHAVER